MKTLYGHPIHFEILKQLMFEGLAVRYRDLSTRTTTYGLTPSARRLLLNKNPVKFMVGGSEKNTVVQKRWFKT